MFKYNKLEHFLFVEKNTKQVENGQRRQHPQGSAIHVDPFLEFLDFSEKTFLKMTFFNENFVSPKKSHLLSFFPEKCCK